MRKYIVIAIINIILIFLEESFFYELFGAELNPNLVIALSFALIIVKEDELALYAALIGGFFLDLLGAGIIGLSSLTLILLMQISMKVGKTIYRGLITQLIFIVITTIVYKILMNYPPLYYNKTLFFSGVMTASLSVLISQALARFKKRYLSTEFRIKA